jgi:ABC-type uncharacterized transport system permease subunit
MKRYHILSDLLTIIAAVALALGLTTLILAAVGAPPDQAFGNLLRGAFGALTEDGALNLLNPRTGATLAFWIPLLLCSTGLLLTFTGGLWNIGVEGQMTMGAVAASFIALQVGATVMPTDLAVVTTLRRARAITTVDSLANLRVGVADASTLADMNLPDVAVVSFGGGFDEAATALRDGAVDVVIGERAQADGSIGEGTGLMLSDIELTRHLPGPLLLITALIAAMAGGCLWGLVCGVLKAYGKVHEIFGGVALNNLASIFAIYLIAGPWQPPEGGSAQATPPFPEYTLLPRLKEIPLSPLALALALIFFAAVYLALRGTFWGLQLKAMGKNARSAFLLGVPTEKHTLIAFAACGALAGVAGSTRALGFYNSLRPNIAGGIGFLALLVTLLSRVRAPLVPFISFYFAAILSGSTQLKIKMEVDASLAGVLQGFLVLAVIIALGVRGRLTRPSTESA